jgi:universal stress protein E
VLVAVDPAHARARPSGLDQRLLTVGASVARRGDGRLALVHVRDLTSSPVADARAAVARLARRHGVPAKQQILREGVPAEQITATADDLGASLLVMGAVSRSAGESAYLGNTAEVVIDGVACDVLVIKGRGFRTRVPRRGPRLPPA